MIAPGIQEPQFRVLRLRGAAGETGVVEIKNDRLFKPWRLYASDTSARPGHGTFVEELTVGRARQFERLPTWTFGEYVPEEGDSFDGVRAANAAVRYEWSAWHLGFDVRARVSFQETCAWTAVFWGRGLR